MLNEPPDHQRRVHPLERPPQTPAEHQPEEQQVMLHIPFVKPYIMWGLIAVNVLIYVIGWLIPRVGNDFLFYGANNQTAVLIDGEYVRLLYAMFLHASPAHVFFNMYALYAIGSSVEGLFGHARFIIIYLLGGLTGSLLSILLNGPDVMSVGASGAVFAIFGAEIVYVYQHRKLLGERGRSRLRSLLIIAGMNFALGLATSLNLGGVIIDNWGHVGGFLGGILLTWYIGPLFLLRRHPQREGAFLAEDANPLIKNYQVVSLYSAALIGILIVATLIMR
ncbi:MAG TPA: rhomboid family intramembrane serine protease [Phototrophicaceae bacterium]|jgi:rhomboid protease GluP|nr:rhomboid family intramembrane serine protease [Phototrophicaceae bacterium]